MSDSVINQRGDRIYEAAYPKPSREDYDSDWVLFRAQAIEEGQVAPPNPRTVTVTVQVTFDQSLAHPEEVARRLLYKLHDGDSLSGGRSIWQPKRSHLWDGEWTWLVP